MGTTQTDVFNHASRMIADVAAVDIPQQNNSLAKILLASWDSAVLFCLHQHPWSHNQKWSTLAMTEDAPPFGYSHSYRLPGDALSIIDIRGWHDLALPGLTFELVGNLIFTDCPPPCHCRYITKTIDTSVWPPDFAELVACKLALEAAPSITSEYLQMQQLLQNNFQLLLDIAKRNDYDMNKPSEIDQRRIDKILNSRKGLFRGVICVDNRQS